MGNFSYRHPLKSLIFNMLSPTIGRETRWSTVMDIVFKRRKALTGAKLVPDLRRSDWRFH